DIVTGSPPCWTGWCQPAYPSRADGFDCRFNRGVCGNRRRACRQTGTTGRAASPFAFARSSVATMRRGGLRLENGSCVSHDVEALVCSLPGKEYSVNSIKLKAKLTFHSS